MQKMTPSVQELQAELQEIERTIALTPTLVTTENGTDLNPELIELALREHEVLLQLRG